MPEGNDVSQMPCMQGLDAFATTLPPESRKELYERAEAFLHIGAGFGAMIGAMSLCGGTNTSERDAFVDYLRQKATEAEVS